MRRILVFSATVVLAATFVGIAVADSVYHTERLELRGVGGAPGGGMVVNIHPNGPNVYAHEIYTLRHAVPGTYQVSLNLFLTSLNCTGPTAALPTATTEPRKSNSRRSMARASGRFADRRSGA